MTTIAPKTPPARRAPIAVARAAAALAAVLLVSRYAPARAGDEPPPVEGGEQQVLSTPHGFTVHASNGSLPNVLAALGGHAGFSVLDSGKSYPVVNALIEDQPLDRVLRQLLRNTNFIIVYRGGRQGRDVSGSGIERIVLLTSGGTEAGSGGAGRNPGSPLAGPGGNRAATAPSQPQASQPQDAATAMAAAAAAAAGKDPANADLIRRLREARQQQGGRPGEPIGAPANPNEPDVLEMARRAAEQELERQRAAAPGDDFDPAQPFEPPPGDEAYEGDE